MNKDYLLLNNISSKKLSYLKDSLQREPIFCKNTSRIVFLDCETTGLDIGCYGKDEILEISIINEEGNILLTTLLKPYDKKDWSESVWIHNITPDMVSEMPYPHEIIPTLLGILNTAKVIVGYNVSFDLLALESIGIKWNGQVNDVMKMFIPIYKEATGNWRNQKLSTCAAYYNYNFKSSNHRSLENVNATLHCYKCISNNVEGHKISLSDLINKYKKELVGYCERNINDYESKIESIIKLACKIIDERNTKRMIGLFHSNMSDKELSNIWLNILYYAKGVSVTERVKRVKQPYGGYVNPRNMGIEKLDECDDRICDILNENISPTLIGLVVDYLARIILGEKKESVFHIALKGAAIIDEKERDNRRTQTKNALRIIKKISSIDNESIKYACRLVQYDSWGRGGVSELNWYLSPNQYTLDNIKCMIHRCTVFFEKYGPIIESGFTFEGGYSHVITSGDGDYISNDTIWDFKVSKNLPSKENTLQLMVYYIMGKVSTKDIFNQIKQIGICNPRLNIVALKRIKDIDNKVLMKIADKVIGYGL